MTPLLANSTTVELSAYRYGSYRAGTIDKKLSHPPLISLWELVDYTGAGGVGGGDS